MDNCVSALSNIKTGIIEIIKQINALENIHLITLTELPTYVSSMNALQESVENLYSVFIYEIPEQHKLRLVLIQTLEIEINNLNKILNFCIKWHNNIIGDSCCFLNRIKTGIINSPTSIEEKLNNGFQKVIPLIKDMITLEKDIFGSAIRIKHPILRRCWISIGGNQLNDNEIPSNTLTQSLYVMLKKEENGTLKKEDYCKQMIRNFVRFIDSLAGTEPDGKITVEELCQIKITPENSLSIKGLLGIVKQPNEEISKEIILSFKGPLKINNTHIIEENKYRGYGCDWPTKVACEFVIPNIDSEDDLHLFGVNVICNAIDQGFGGTGHAQVRFQVNDEVAVPAFSIWRDKVPDNIYKFSIGPDKVKIGDTIKIWVCCPPWNAWSLTLNSINATAIFA